MEISNSGSSLTMICRGDVVSDKGDHSGPVELTMDVLDHLSDARVSSQVMVMVGVQDVQLDVLIVGNIEQSLVLKEVVIL